MRNILITGSNGQLGSEIKALETYYQEFNFIFTDIEELDLTDRLAIEKCFEEKQIEACINCAAYTAVDKAEEDQDMAMLVNFKAVENLAQACERKRALLMHISTDYVFDGTYFKPYSESDPTSPNSFYGRSKLKGEEAVMINTSRAVIVRTSWLYSTYGNNFVKTMMRLGKERQELGVVVDQIGTPTYAADLARVLLEIVQKTGNKPIKEIYHYSNEGVISWYDFAQAIMFQSGLNCKVNAIESKDFPAKANRPFYSVLNKAKIKRDFEIKVPYWLDSLKIMLHKELNKTGQ